MKRPVIILIGAAASVAFTALWHGPLGAGEQLASQAEAQARRTLDKNEMHMIEARMQRGPLTRQLVLTGPADDFQRSELVRILDETPGVLEVRWDPASLPQEQRVGR